MERIVVMLSTYNGEAYLEKQLQSIADQTVDADVTLYVRDDGSSDRTIEILRSWEDRLNISYCTSDGEVDVPNRNLGSARSFWRLFLTAPDADYYAFVDQDDIWDAKKLEKALEVLRTRTGPTVCACNARVIDEHDRVIQRRFHEQPPQLTPISQLVCGSLQGSAMVMNAGVRDYFRKHRIVFLPMHDIVIVLYMLLRGELVYQHEPLFSYRMHSSNVVAKQGKSIPGKLKSTCRAWFVNRYGVSGLAGQVLRDNETCMDAKTVHYYRQVLASRHSLRARRYLARSPLTASTHARGVRSFKIRALLGLL